MIYLKKFEDIKIPINVGDTILGGRFKNKKTIVKKIGKNAKGDITVNGKPLLKYRLMKEGSEESFAEESRSMLRQVEDMGFIVKIVDEIPYSSSCDWKNETISIEIYREIPGEDRYSFDCPKFEWREIAPDVQAYMSFATEELGYDLSAAFYIASNEANGGFKRTQVEMREIKSSDFGSIKKMGILLKKNNLK